MILLACLLSIATMLRNGIIDNNAPRPSSSRKYIATHPEVLAVYNSGLKWNLTKKGGKPHKYKGDLVKNRDEEAGGDVESKRGRGLVTE
jgi:hypothetical protein